MEIILSIVAVVLSVTSGGFTLYSFAWILQSMKQQAKFLIYGKSIKIEIKENFENI